MRRLVGTLARTSWEAVGAAGTMGPGEERWARSGGTQA